MREGAEFTSEVWVGRESFADGFSTDDVKNEPMLFNAGGRWAHEHGGPITRAFLEALGEPLDRIVFDSRVHMLMAGWLPCIPGWHHDDVPRLRSDGQPWYPELVGGKRPEGLYRSSHAMAIVGDPICATEFALGTAAFPQFDPGEVAYGKWHPVVDEHLEAGRLESWSAPMGVVIWFDDRAWHQGVPATGFGWRWFGRASWSTARVASATNEVRQQVQVYLPAPNVGW